MAKPLRINRVLDLALTRSGDVLVAGMGGIALLRAAGPTLEPLDPGPAIQVAETAAGLAVLAPSQSPAGDWRPPKEVQIRKGSVVRTLVSPMPASSPNAKNLEVRQILPSDDRTRLAVAWLGGFTGQEIHGFTVYDCAIGEEIRTERFGQPDRDQGSAMSFSSSGSLLVWHSGQMLEIPLPSGAVTSRPSPLRHEVFRGGYFGGFGGRLHSERQGSFHLLHAHQFNSPHQSPAFLVDERDGKVVTFAPCDAVCLGAVPETVITVDAQTLDVFDLSGRPVQRHLRDVKTKVLAALMLPSGTWCGATPKTLELLALGASERTPTPPAREREVQPAVRTDDPRVSLWKQPDDRAALAVFADWVAEQGATTRAEYIALSLLAERTPEQEKRRQTLLKKHRGDWLGEARRFVRSWEDSTATPGFVSEVRCTPDQLLEGVGHMKWLGPRLQLTVLTIKNLKQAQALGALDLGFAYALKIVEDSSRWFTPRVVGALCPALATLREVHFTWGDSQYHFPPEAVEQVLQSASQARVVSLGLPADVLLQVSPKAASHLETLRLFHRFGQDALRTHFQGTKVEFVE